MAEDEEWYAYMEDHEPDELAHAFVPVERDEYGYTWPVHAHRGQLPPPGDWSVWLIMAGRGFGKTRAGAEWVRFAAESDPGARIALVAATLGEARSVMVEGESGILACCPPHRRPQFEPSLQRLTWPSGAQARLYSALEPEALRGPQHSHAWCDELAKWSNAGSRAVTAWDNLSLGMRVGGHAVPLGSRQWRLSNLLRGRGGTELAVEGHTSDEEFVLLDSRPVLLDPAIVGNTPETQIVAVGRGDAVPVTAGVAMQGITLRPLFPVHPRISSLADGSLRFDWTRRSRGAWSWKDGVDSPLHEQAEAYQATYGPVDSPLAVWLLDVPQLTLSPQDQADLAARRPGGQLLVRQQGSYDLSEPLFLSTLP